MSQKVLAMLNAIVLAFIFGVHLGGCEYRPVEAQKPDTLGPDLIDESQVGADHNCPCGPNCQCPDCQCNRTTQDDTPKFNLIDGQFHVIMLKHPAIQVCPNCDRWLRTVSMDLQRQGFKVGVRWMIPEETRVFDRAPVFYIARPDGSTTTAVGFMPLNHALTLLND